MIKKIIVLSLLVCLAVPFTQAADTLDFSVQTISPKAELWWARAVVDINGDGVLDVALQNNNGHGGWLGWLEGQTDKGDWNLHIIAEKGPDGETFACGDLDAGDIDNDGDIDILGFQHPGEWDEGSAPTQIFWYENPSWKAHRIGEAPDFIKDVNLADLNKDGKLDVVVNTFEENSLRVFRQDSPQKWINVLNMKVTNLHEGMDVGDIDGDGDLDIAANGYWIENPGKAMSEKWNIHNIADKWHNQEGDWSRNATKHFCRDINGDGKAEVFITHSERKGYPLAWYESSDPKKGPWKEHVIAENLTAAHNLQVFDIDNDGDFDVLTGLNKNRAKNLGETSFPVILFLNQGDNMKWDQQVLSTDGIYNAQIADLENDGDLDIYRLPTHDGEVFEVWINQIKKP